MPASQRRLDAVRRLAQEIAELPWSKRVRAGHAEGDAKADLSRDLDLPRANETMWVEFYHWKGLRCLIGDLSTNELDPKEDLVQSVSVATQPDEHASDSDDAKPRTNTDPTKDSKFTSSHEGRELPVLQLDIKLALGRRGEFCPDERAAFIAKLAAIHSGALYDIEVATVAFKRVTTGWPAADYRVVANRSHGLLVTTPESVAVTSRMKLLQMDALDAGNALAVSAATTLNERIQFAAGEGSVLDAAVLLAHHGLARIDATLRASIDTGQEEDKISFRLLATIHLTPLFFEARYMSLPRRLIVETMFPPDDSEQSEDVTVNMFYDSLHRAPKTIDGLPVSIASSSATTSVALTPAGDETEEERTARLGRLRKGKGRAIEEEKHREADEEADDWQNMNDDVEMGIEDDLIKPVGLIPTLLPFQSRSVRWMLQREGKRIMPRRNSIADGVMTVDQQEDDHAAVNSNPRLEDLSPEMLVAHRRGPLWEQVETVLADGRKQTFWLNRVMSALSLNDPGTAAGKNVDEAYSSGGNGLLAEEVGLGKTVEVLSLILLHQDPERSSLPSYFNAATDTHPQPTGLTLIIAPSTLTGQWQSEIARHAPSLRVLRYEGVRKMHPDWTPLDIADKYDVLLTTYEILRREVVLARKPHERALRSAPDARARYRRSLLVEIDFLRVIMDEAQMIGDAVSGTSETASLIPRKFSFAVTSTPLRARIEDLQGILAFLRLEPFNTTRSALTRLLEEPSIFKRLCNELGARTMKAQVEHELVLPDQERYVVPVEFSAVEKYWYDSKYLECLDALGLQQDGTPKDDVVGSSSGQASLWVPKPGLLNRSLVQLRQICCHPQIGQGAKVVLGGVLKTVEDVLKSMKDKAVSAILVDRRQLLDTRIKRAQLMCYDKEDCERFEIALEIYQSTLLDLQPVIDDLVVQIKEAWAQRVEAKRARHDTPGAESALTTLSNDTDDSIVQALRLGFQDKEEEPDEHKLLSDKERTIARKLGAMSNRLRDFLSIEHNALFFSGNAYFNMGKFADEEAEMYRRAEQLRVKILNPWERQVDKANKLLQEQIAERDSEQELTIDDLELHFGEVGHGLMSVQSYENAEITIDVLNGYAELIWQWRTSIFEWMSTRVSIAGDDATGEEYAERAELQERLNVYLEAYAVLLAEWRHGITGEKSALADQLNQDLFGNVKKNEWAAKDPDSKRRRKRYVPLSERRVPTLEAGDTPEDILRFDLLRQRVEARGEGQEELEVVPLRSSHRALLDASETAHNNQEYTLLKKEADRLRKEIAEKEKLADRFRDELNDVTKAFNARLNYFAQLQVLSDAVADPNLDPRRFRGFIIELEAMAAEEEQLELSVKAKESSRRYLETLNDQGHNEVDTTCVICSDTYTRGALTTCGHLFCASCFQNWYQRQRTCALCKRNLKQGDWEIVKYRHPRTVGDDDADEVEEKAQLRLEYEALDASVLGRAPKLNTLTKREIAQIESMATAAPYSSKSNFIVKHVRWIRSNDPSAKIVVFSAWRESLDILCKALSSNGIEFVRLDHTKQIQKTQHSNLNKEQSIRRFVEDPDVVAFLLHTKSQSAGLNLTCAKYVFMVEPLLHPSLEIQAVARVHRIGQKNDTKVFQYFVSDSVDQRVAELRARNKTSLFTPKVNRDTAEESRISQQDMSTANAKGATGGGEEAIDDEDEISRCLLKAEHYLNLQRTLLPMRLRGLKRPRPEDDNVAEAGRALGGDDDLQAPRRLAGLAAINRAMDVDRNTA
ncbi:hypothetical protein OIO90_004737 [Microbotryomycetes sp. JL221]|nr:hypothetical protein OIO90_004737 [Microbotryomycetes sp. JL221]